MAWVAALPHGCQRAPNPKEPGLQPWGWDGCDGGWFPVPSDHKFISWDSHVFCDLHFLTL